MSEGPPKSESVPTSGTDAFEALVGKGEWNAETERALQMLLESHEEDLYTVYLNYQESGLVESLPEHERQMYEWLAKEFE